MKSLIPARVAALAALVAITTSACADSMGGGFDYECPESPLLQVSLLDISASGRSETVLTERLNAIQVDAERVADCDGELVVASWAGPSSSSDILFTGTIPVAGATEIGKDRKIPEAVEKVMEELRANLQVSLGRLSPDNSDLIGGFYLLSDLVTGKGAGKSVTAHLFTDGISTSGAVIMNDAMLDQAAVDRLVSEQTVPGLQGVEVRLYGIGRVAVDIQPPQDFIQLVQNYSAAICSKTGALCSVFTTVVS
jgi:hypothetical protein